MLNDIELSLLVGESVNNDYVTALDFIESNPDYSLQKFREIAETIVVVVADANHFVLKDRNLLKQIYSLHKAKLINGKLSSSLHKIREFGNTAVHRLADEKLFNIRKQDLLSNANEARRVIISAFEDVYMLLNSGVTKLQCTDLVQSGGQKHREIIYDAHVLMCYSTKLKAGIICESQLDRHIMVTPTANHPYEHDVQKHLLQSSAFGFFDAACALSAEIGVSADKKNVEESIKCNANTEALFRYARLVLYHTDFETESSIKAIAKNRLKAAAKRDYGPAQALYGIFLYEMCNYSEALPYLLHAEDKGDTTVLRMLFYFYTDGEAVVKNIEKGLAYLNRAVDLKCPDSMAALGIAYIEGQLVTKNVAKGKRLLNESIKKGSIHGLRMLEPVLEAELQRENVKARQIAKALLFSDLNLPTSPHKKYSSDIGTKIKPNAPCGCGSGVKYKKCCRG